MARRLQAAMAYEREIVVELRTRPARSVRGLVTRCEVDKRKRGGEGKEHSNLVVTIGGERVDVERVGRVRLPPPSA